MNEAERLLDMAIAEENRAKAFARQASAAADAQLWDLNERLDGLAREAAAEAERLFDRAVKASRG